jgi:hypothetical protein
MGKSRKIIWTEHVARMGKSGIHVIGGKFTIKGSTRKAK